MKQVLTRRRFLTIAATAALLPGVALGATAPLARWQGIALGARASMTLVGLRETEAADLFAEVENEIFRLEGLFSLYRADSALVRLNQTGRLTDPPADFLDLLALAGRLQRTTDGAFDPTVQPLWLLHAAAAAQGRQPPQAEIAEVRQRSGWQHLRLTAQEVSFARPGMALTLNGIAQGFIADRIAALLRARGLSDVLVDMGEIAALGRRPDGAAWRAGIALPDGRIVREMTLSDRALATSAPLGTLLDPSGNVGHILDPRDGRPGGRWQLVSVSARQAALADGLSTAFCLMSRDAIDAALDAHPGASLEALV